MTIRIILADDHPAVLAGTHHELKAFPELNVVGLARDSGELVRLLRCEPCDVLVTDYAMPGGEFGDGMALISYLRENFHSLKLIVFTTLNNVALNAALKDKGVWAVANKSNDIQLLAASIFSAYSNNDLPRRYHSTDDVMLSAREEEVISLYISGLSINEIAERLNRTKQTISSQKSNAMLKLGLTRDADLFHFALETGLKITKARDATSQISPDSEAALDIVTKPL